jgi:hypothetical protein
MKTTKQKRVMVSKSNKQRRATEPKKATKVKRNTAKQKSTAVELPMQKVADFFKGVLFEKMMENVEDAGVVANHNGFFIGDVWESCMKRVFKIHAFEWLRNETTLEAEVVAVNRAGETIPLTDFGSTTHGYHYVTSKVTGDQYEEKVDCKSWHLLTGSRMRVKFNREQRKKKKAEDAVKRIQPTLWVTIL